MTTHQKQTERATLTWHTQLQKVAKAKIGWKNAAPGPDGVVVVEVVVQNKITPDFQISMIFSLIPLVNLQLIKYTRTMLFYKKKGADRSSKLVTHVNSTGSIKNIR